MEPSASSLVPSRSRQPQAVIRPSARTVVELYSIQHGLVFGRGGRTIMLPGSAAVAMRPDQLSSKAVLPKFA